MAGSSSSSTRMQAATSIPPHSRARNGPSSTCPEPTNTGATNPNSQGQVGLTYWEDDGVFHLAIWQRGHYTYLSDPPEGYLF